jgi:TfoX/Sxy family transcriptional regulator of competence genes
MRFTISMKSKDTSGGGSIFDSSPGNFTQATPHNKNSGVGGDSSAGGLKPSYKNKAVKGKNMFTEKILFKIKPSQLSRLTVNSEILQTDQQNQQELMQITWEVPPPPKGQRRYVDYFSVKKEQPRAPPSVQEAEEAALLTQKTLKKKQTKKTRESNVEK